MIRVIRRIFPTAVACRHCGGDTVAQGSSRGGLLRYRRCRVCSEVTTVAAIGEEIHDGRSSRVRPLA